MVREVLEETGVDVARRALPLLAAVAVSVLADDRLRGARRRRQPDRGSAASSRTRAGSRARRSRSGEALVPPSQSISWRLIEGWLRGRRLTRMCLLVLAWQVHPRYRLVVAANRDEFHERPAAPLAKWPRTGRHPRRARPAGAGHVAGPRPRAALRCSHQLPRAAAAAAGGTLAWWPDPALPRRQRRRRGLLRRARAARRRTTPASTCCSPTPATLWYGSNRAAPFARALPPGIYGLSNELLDTPWPKLTRVRAGFEAWLQTPAAAPAGLFSLLADRTPAPQAQTDTGGLSPEWDRVLSAPFVLHPRYGTRCATVLLLGAAGESSADRAALRRRRPGNSAAASSRSARASGRERCQRNRWCAR